MRLIDADALMLDIKRTVDSQPAQPPLIKDGMWLISDETHEIAACSICEWDSHEAYGNVVRRYRFCPNCGARMDALRKRPQENVDRNNEIYESRKRGEGFTEISKKFNITAQRARQIFYKEARIRMGRVAWWKRRTE